ncbi:lipopolysaccharide assembly protein LapA domain-containing protein [Paeniglutamicibacter quisquiliarum]|uniref:lipopolysaccharide assembly protein LapA domain-containing protein n=1 Tax=Paeniglutamicibacter quisquiliarum TaxID=2849498 RepID=UPI00300DB2B3
MIWTFTIVAIVVLVLLVIFMMQNQGQATVYFLGLEGQMALGVAMLLAAVGGAVVVAVVAAVRIIQLRSRGGAAARRLDHGKK